MALIVKKFGGSSVATPEKIFNIVDRVLREKQADDKIVLVPDTRYKEKTIDIGHD